VRSSPNKAKRRRFLSYHEGLSFGDREELFEFMRKLGSERCRYESEARKLCPRFGEIAVGSAHFDPFVRQAVIEEFLSQLRKGATPEEARDRTIEYGRKCVAVHNAKRPKDINWARWSDTATDFVERLHRRCPKVGATGVSSP
jgi:hypothetical protein